jgi:hypothetical protein
MDTRLAPPVWLTFSMLTGVTKLDAHTHTTNDKPKTENWVRFRDNQL